MENLEQEHQEQEQETIPVPKAEWEKYQGLSKTLGDNFDAERYAKIKDLDPDEYASMKRFTDIVEKNDKVYEITKEILAAEKEKRQPDFVKILGIKAASEAGLPGGGTAPKAGVPSVDPKIQAQLDRLTKDNEARQAQEIEAKFNAEFDKAVGGFGKMSEREKSILKMVVTDAFLKNEKLNLPDVAKITKQFFDSEIVSLRKELLGDRYRELIDESDKSPSPMRGGGPQSPGQKFDPKNATPDERVGAFSKELKEALAGQ